MDTTSAPLLYRPEEAAQLLGLGRSTVFELIASGQLASVRVGRLRRIPADALRSFISDLQSVTADVG
jgi:excisionase family DNA binding protein